MRIVIDARMWNESGIGRYLRNLIGQLQILDKKNDYYLLLLQKDYDVFEFQSNFHKVAVDFRWYTINEKIKLPKVLNKIKPDLVHLPHFNVPIFYKGKFVVTIHDLIHQHFNFQRSTTHDPLTFKLKQFGYKQIFRNAINKSSNILVPSNFVKDQLMNEWKVNKNKIVTTYEGVDNEVSIIGDKISKQKINKILDKFNIKLPFTAKQEPSGFIFYVGNAHPHKNIEGLIKSFLILRKNYQYLTLVLSGEDNYFWQRIRQEYQYKDIIYTGRISDEELVALYKSAKCFVMPSFEEGFGVPILEAFQIGCPVVSSSGGSLKEVGDNAAIYFDPRSTDGIVEKIQMVLNSEEISKQLIEKGKERVKQFSWKKLAEQTMEVYQNAGSTST